VRLFPGVRGGEPRSRSYRNGHIPSRRKRVRGKTDRRGVGKPAFSQPVQRILAKNAVQFEENAVPAENVRDEPQRPCLVAAHVFGPGALGEDPGEETA